MDIKKRIIHDTFLDEFLYNLMYNSTRHQRERFPDEYQGIFRSSKNAKGFIARATMEQKLYCLSLFGIEWFLFCGTRKNATTELKQIIAHFKNDNHSEALDLITKKNIFIISNDQFIDYMGIMARVTHNKAYSYNVEMMKVGYHLHSWKKDVEFKKYTEVSENKESYESIVRFVKSILLNKITIEPNHGINETELLVISFLYEKKNAYISHVAVCNYFGGIIKAAEVSAAIKRLREINYIRISAISDGKEYIITAIGIEKLNNFINKTLTTNL